MEKIKFLFILTCFNCFSQSVEVKYYENPIIANLEQHIALPKNVQIAFEPNLYSYKLITDGKLSKYQNEKINFKIESEFSETKISIEGVDTTKTVYKSDGIDLRTKEKLFFKDFNNNKLFCEQFFEERIKYTDSIPKWNWKILDETETIQGYKCKKATASNFGRDFYVWFAEDIPISDGPLNYSGLPGLILKVRLKGIEIIAYNIEFKKEKFDISPPVFTGKVYNSFKELVNEMNKRNREPSQNRLDPKGLKPLFNK
ncbi:MAG: GLPGLI family protein [Flavobacterium sp.]|jgi:GLPGLI family protein|uniref:GLPGLI family protein n=1 Tax=Flavobacterium sp. TaxID=239 RepID=UPI0022BB7668|nr:GLPGLI family protein [Flavobacterium sp.]MCZ8089419.1 GLPGLI family protein [Flavobacterium sp.]MCZ8331223.1 GLPGLI family protein [Flavobacterium sp.]